MFSPDSVVTRVTFHPGCLEQSPFSPVISSFIVTIPEWTLHHLVTSSWSSSLHSPLCFSFIFSDLLSVNASAFPDDGQVPKSSAWKSTFERGQRPAPLGENCDVLGPGAQYLPSCLLIMQLTLCLCTQREEGSALFPAVTPHRIIFHLGFPIDE